MDNIADPDVVLNITGFDGEGLIVPVKINNSNKVIGYYQKGEQGPGSDNAFDGKTETGFIINANGSGSIILNQPNHVVNRPADINDDGLIVGEFISEQNFQGSANVSPTYAFSINSDGTGFVNLHPDEAYYSAATHITSHPYVLGHYSNTEQGSVACMFRGDSVVNLVDSATVLFSGVHATNSEYAIIYGSTGQVRQYYAYHFQTQTLTQLNIPPSVADFSAIHSINEQGIAVGYSLDFVQSDAFIGLVYDLNTNQLRLHKSSTNFGGSSFVGYKFLDINEDGLIAGFAERPYQGGFLQSRAMIMDSRFQDFRDITPSNGNAYSEMVSINDSGVALGYLGIPKGSQVVNKMMVIDVSGN